MALTNPIETIDERPTCCEYAAGRAFYGLKNTIYYSQIMEGESIDSLSKCYQKNDPTAEQVSNLLDTDGGTIQVDNATNIVQIKKFAGGLLIYSVNGVWYLSGPDTGFTATNFSLDQISSAGCVSPESVVDTETAQYYWSNEGIFVITLTDVRSTQVVNIAEPSIQSLYNTIPPVSKSKAFGTYNRVKKQVEWLYNTDTQEGTDEYKHAINRSLVLDLRVGGFWPQSYNGITTEGLGKFIACSVNTTAGTEDEDSILVGMSMGAPSTTQNYSATFGPKTNTGFVELGDNIPTAYIETGYEALDKPSNKKSTPYMVTHFLQTEENWIDDGAGGLTLDLPSGCQMRAKWDWNNSVSNGRWSPSQQAYRFRRTYVPTIAEPFDSGEAVVTTKNKMLGRGKALSIRFEQEVGKDMKLLGYTLQWSIKGRM